ncbi:hypothetical protein [Puia dinghuensis]|uniref:Alpha/beta hydrolase n=1 Tax=Puia dinghuensis TaxID=1792502 RepID=A0A8J2XSK3_9BACT|nr:hypothetical protein [Puia dinghuensis]GGA96115.1 hypothetical protein GCM10011511_19250 [Puia dinghuensis]
MKYLLTGYLIGAIFIGVRAQEAYQILHFSSPHNCFPDTARDHGHLDGDGNHLPREGHYDDSSVLLVVPAGLHMGKAVDLVVWFHGWHNSIDTALQFYGLARQFAASGRNAVLVLPEAAKNAADSYGGKMRREGMFKLLVADVLEELMRQRVVPADAQAGHIVLAGHSGAYSVMADILENGGQAVDEVFLFDALYGRLNTFTRWAEDGSHHFVHWFTNTGYGPDKMSDTMMLRLRQYKIPYGLSEEASVDDGVIKNNRILFVHSPREHNVIINNPDDFALLLKNSFILANGHPFEPE